jgi:ribosomal protein S18 acetylase RimI-like enzyme
MGSNLTLVMITLSDNLENICAQMQPDLWGKDNEMTSYQPENLNKFLKCGGLLLLAKDDEKIAGAALCYELPHPAGEHSLYVHELDTHPHYRRQGVATALMNELNKIAAHRGLTEVWLGTETDNDAANAFYKSLHPYEIEPSIIYAYKTNQL